jgi:hypothetical protein
MPEEYWLYGISKEDYLSACHDFKFLRKTLDTILELSTIKSANEIFDHNNNPKDSLGRLLISALKADIECIIKK